MLSTYEQTLISMRSLALAMAKGRGVNKSHVKLCLVLVSNSYIELKDVAFYAR